jgi:hypothetical protein
MKNAPNGLALPESLAKFINNGGETIEAEDGDWHLTIEPPPEELKHFFPEHALVFAGNEAGDFLFIRRSTSGRQAYGQEVYVYWHDEKRWEVYSEQLPTLLRQIEPAVSVRKKIYYHGGQTEVKLGDEVSARDLILRKNGRVAYVPGVSKRNRELERSGMAWIGIRFSKGTIGGAWVEPETSWVKKSVRFIRRSAEHVDEIGPNEKFE